MNINKIPKDIHAGKETSCTINGRQVSLNGVNEVGFDFESEVAIFLDGMAYVADRTNATVITSEPFWRKPIPQTGSPRAEFIIRIAVNQDDWSDDDDTCTACGLVEGCHTSECPNDPDRLAEPVTSSATIHDNRSIMVDP